MKEANIAVADQDAMTPRHPDVLLISVSDKLHNARAILRDYRAHGEALWGRFRGGKAGTLWYYRALVDTYRARGLERYVDELDHVVRSLEDATGAVASDTARG